MSHSDKRSLWQVAEILGWSQTDLGRVRDFYCQPPILLAFAPFFEFRLADGLKKGYRASKVAALAFGALQGLDGKNYMGEIDEIEDPTIGDFDVWFTIRLIEVCRAQVSSFSHMSFHVLAMYQRVLEHSIYASTDFLGNREEFGNTMQTCSKWLKTLFKLARFSTSNTSVL
jgi:hypothetical protein